MAVENGVGTKVAEAGFDYIVDEYHRALDEFVRGNAEPQKDRFSHSNDVSLANPYGPAVCGWEQVAQVMDRAASLLSDGRSTGFDRIATHVTPELAFIVEVERYLAKTAGTHDAVPFALRVTTIFRRENATWKVVHRHADPITAPRPPESILQQ